MLISAESSTFSHNQNLPQPHH